MCSESCLLNRDFSVLFWPAVLLFLTKTINIDHYKKDFFEKHQKDLQDKFEVVLFHRAAFAFQRQAYELRGLP